MSVSVRDSDRSPRPAVWYPPHPLEVHVHDPGVEPALAVEGNKVTRGTVVVEAWRHRRYLFGGKIIEESPEVFRRPADKQFIEYR